MTTLIEFLRARLDEDRTVAQVAGGGPWCGVSMRDEGGATREQANHILRWDPSRVLAEVEAKRRIVDLCAALADPGQSFRASTIERTVLRELVQPYASHPDFDRDWLLLASTI